MLKILYVFLIVFLIIFYYVTPDDMDKTIMSGLLIIVLFSIVLFSLRKEKNKHLKGQYLKHSTLALLGIVIVFFQFPLDYVLGNVSKSNMLIWVDRSIVLKSLTLSVIGLLSFLLGYLLFKKEIRVINSRTEKPASVKVLNISAAIALAVYFLTINPLYLAGYYGRIDMGPNATYAITFFQIIIYATVIQKCRNMILLNEIPVTFVDYIRKMGWPLILLIGLYLLSVLISGDRAPLVFYSLLIFSGYFFVTQRKLSLKYALLFLFIAASGLTLLGIARGMNTDLSFYEKIQHSIDDPYLTKESSISPRTATLAGSVKALNAAVAYVPAKHDFFYGRFQFLKLTGTIPFFSIFYPIIFHNNSTKYGGSGKFITWILMGDNPTSGQGTSCIADFYLDFGLVGVIIGMLFFGYMMRFAEMAMFSGKFPTLLTQIFFMVYLTLTVYIARDTVLTGLKIIVWIYLILFLNKKLLQRAYRKL